MTGTDIEQDNSLLAALEFSAQTDIGMRREENQDSYDILESAQYKLYIVADGMGGVRGGAIASKLAVDTVREKIGPLAMPEADDILATIAASNHAIYQKGLEERGLTGMGTTMVGLCFRNDQVLVLNVGDSRAYRIRGGQIVQLTEDHTLVAELLKAGTITEDQVANHPISHMLTRSLGPAPQVDADCGLLADAPQVNDGYLLCSDGLYNHVNPHEIGEIVNTHDTADAVHTLIELAKERGGLDNITVILIKVTKEYDSNFQVVQATQVRSLSDEDTLENVEILSGTSTNGHAELNGAKQTNAASAAEDPLRIVSNVNSEKLHSKLIDEQRQQQQQLDQEAVSVDAAVTNQAAPPVISSGYGFKHLLVLTTIFMAFGLAILILLEQLSTHDGSEIALSSSNNPNLVEHDLNTAENADEDRDDEFLNTVESNEPTDETVAAIPVETQAQEAEQLLAEASNAAAVNTETVEQAETATAEQADIENEAAAQPTPPPSEFDLMRNRRNDLKLQIEKVESRLAAFDRPISGSVAEELFTVRRAHEALQQNLKTIIDQIEVDNRNLASWSGRRQRMASVDVLKIAAEISGSLEAVHQQKERFENVTWKFIKQREVLTYKPDDQEEKRKTQVLLEERKAELEKLKEVVAAGIDQEIAEINESRGQLTLKKIKLEEEYSKSDEELNYLAALLSQDSQKKLATKQKFLVNKQELEAELASLDKLLSETLSSSLPQ